MLMGAKVPVIGTPTNNKPHTRTKEFISVVPRRRSNYFNFAKLGCRGPGLAQPVRKPTCITCDP